MKRRSGMTQLLVRAAVGGVFIYAGAAKVADPQSFAEVIHAFRILPPAWINLLALTLPFFEIALGASLVGGWRVRENALAAALLVFVFLAVLLQAGARGIDTDCGCFGPSAWAALEAVPPVARDLVLLAGALYLRVRGDAGR